MDREEAAQILRQKRAGFERLRQFEIEEARRATFEDRFRAFSQIMRFARRLHAVDTRTDDDEVTQRWMKIRARYESLSR